MNICQCIVHRKRSRGVLGKGRESYTTVATICGKATEGGSMCPAHKAEDARLAAKLAARKSTTITA